MDTNLISVINDLQDAFAAGSSQDYFTLDLPQIAVVGSQSAGKSSVLENIVGKEFLPRGTGIVTRRPLTLQLVNQKAGGEEYGEFLHAPGRRFYDFQEIRQEIQVETDRLTGTNKGISPIPISLKVYSPQVLDLTLVDLPGIAKIPVGDQPADIEKQIRAMVASFIERPNCLILAVTPANTDLATSDALQLARHFDPDGTRTIGVLTKIDLIEEGQDCRNILLNQIVPLRFGYVGVVNRSQKDIDGRKDIKGALEKEAAFFKGHPAYRDLDEKTGTECLRQHLSFHLTRHIADSVPDLKIKLSRRLACFEAELANFKTDFDYDDEHWKPKTLIMLAIRFSEHFKVEITGNDDVQMNYENLSSGAKIMYLFHRDYPQWLANTEFTHEDSMKHQIGYTIQNILGIRTGLFTPDKAFDFVVRTQIEHLKEPTTVLLDKVAEEMELAIQSASKELEAFPALESELKRRGSLICGTFLDRAREHVSQLIDFELAYINTKHEDFVGFSYAEQKAYSRVLKRRNPGATQKYSGWLSILGGFGKGRQKCWFVLTMDNLSWYTDESMAERIYMIPIDENVQFRDPLRDNRLTLFATKGKNIYRDRTQLELLAPNFESVEAWKKNLIQVGVFTEDNNALVPDSYAPSVSQDILSTNDPWLERQIESIWILVDSYMSIVTRTLRDMVPKCIVKLLIKDTVYYFEKNLISELSRAEHIDELMEVNEASIERRRNLQTSVETCKLALERLRNISLPNIKALKIQETPKPMIPFKPQGSNNNNNFVSHNPTKNGFSKSRSSSVPPNSSIQQQKISPTPPAIPERPSAKQIGTAKPFFRAAPSRKSSQELKKALQTIDSSSKSQFY